MCLDRVMAETSGEFQEWMKLALDSDADELPILRVMHELTGQDENQDDTAEKLKKELEERLDRLQKMVQLSEMLARDIRCQIDELERR